jgi:GNAT superfamily N-acetyltransferase
MLTGPDFREEHVLDDGTPVTLRHIRPGDAAELRRVFERLSPSSRYSRFQGVLRELSDDALHYLTNVDGSNHVAIVATTREQGGGPEIGLGVGRFVRTAEDPTTAEPALTVVDEMQHKGLGRILAVTLSRAAIERGIRRFRGQALTDNAPVRELLDEAGAVVRSTPDELVFDVDLETHDEPHAQGRLELIARRVLRAAASRLVGWRTRVPGHA